MYSVKIGAGEFRILVNCNDKSFIKSIKKDYRGFVSDDDEHFTIDLTICDKFVDVQDQLIYFNEGYLCGKVNIEENRGEFNLKGHDKNRFLFILKVCFAIVCSKNNALLFHSAGVLDKNKAYLFCGPQDSGKSTISRLSPHLKLLSDEHVIIQKINNRFRAFGTPLGGEYFKFGKILKPSNTSADIDKIFFIKQAKEHKIAKKKHSEVVFELLNEDFFYLGISKKRSALLKRNFDMIYELSKSISCYDLFFQKNKSFWNEIKQIERGERDGGK